MATVVRSVKRRMRMSLENAQKQKLVKLVEGKTNAEIAADSSLRRVAGTSYQSDIFSQGWEFEGDDGKNLYRLIDVRLAVSEAGNNGGPPKIDEQISQDEALDLFNTLIDGLTPTEISGVMNEVNNGLYLAASAKSKPKAKMSMEDMVAAWSAHVLAQAPEEQGKLWAVYGKAAAEKRLTEFLKEWYKTA